MASPCLSSVLTNANLTMYPTGNPGSTTLPGIETLQIPTTNYSFMTGQWYKQVNPQFWTEQNVLDWISDQIDNIKFDASNLRLSCCTMDGSTLCHLTQDEMVSIFGQPLGQHLSQSLQRVKTTYEPQNLSGPDLTETCQLLDRFIDNLDHLDNMSFPFLSTLKFGEGGVEAKRDFSYVTEYDLAPLMMEAMTPQRETDYLSDSEYSSTSAGGVFGSQNPSSPESRSSDSDPEFSYPYIAKEHIKTENVETKRRPRGRPPKVIQGQNSSFYENPKKHKHAPRGTHLWEFIRDILIHPEKNHGLMKWEDRREGVFKFLKSEAVAQMWGQKKKNSSMTYEKLSRAMRYYYKREILERVDGRRLVYKFGKNSSGWKVDEVAMAT